MNDFYNIDAISKILKCFKVETAIISGVKDENLINSILKYNAKFTHINTADDSNSISDNPLNALQKLEDYNAIFIDDDPNWYTVLNELKIIKNTNSEFPLVFICNNNFPNKRRDSYSNPDKIPNEFRHKYTAKLPIYYNNEKITITDGFYHACEENTSKNGVLTAIEDFLDENPHIGIIKISFVKEICILYTKSQINQKRIKIINKNIQTDKKDFNISDKLIENQILLSYINKYKLFDDNLIDMEAEISKKDSIIQDYKTKIQHQTNQMNLKDTQISGFKSNLRLKESQIKNIESKLFNKNIEINNIENQLKTANSNLNNLKQETDNKNIKINNLKNQIKTANSDFNFLTQKINETADEFTEKKSYYTDKINSLNNKINQNKIDFENTEKELIKQIKTKNEEIRDLKNDLTNKENELTKQKTINNQKENQIKSKQTELDIEKKKLHTFERSYRKNLSKLDNEKYCISCLKEEISNNQLELEYIKNNTITKTILSPIGYLYLLVKSKPKDISLNIKLYRTLKNSNCFDIGFYLHNNKDLIHSKWCKYFSPELHFICNGFDENRKFNKKYFNRNSKKELLEYLLNCEN